MNAGHLSTWSISYVEKTFAPQAVRGKPIDQKEGSEGPWLSIWAREGDLCCLSLVMITRKSFFRLVCNRSTGGYVCDMRMHD